MVRVIPADYAGYLRLKGQYEIPDRKLATGVALVKPQTADHDDVVVRNIPACRVLCP